MCDSNSNILRTHTMLQNDTKDMKKETSDISLHQVNKTLQGILQIFKKKAHQFSNLFIFLFFLHVLYILIFCINQTLKTN